MFSRDIGEVVSEFLDRKHLHATTPEDLEAMIDVFRVRLDRYDNEAIQWVSSHGHIKVVRLLLSDKRVDPAVRNNYAIRWASDNGYLEVVRLLLNDKRVDPAAWDNWSIQWASSNGHLEVVRLLLSDNRVDPTDKNNLAILSASLNSHLDVVRLLLSDNRVRSSLDPTRISEYEKLINP
jgi:ankyrin repeat protein